MADDRAVAPLESDALGTGLSTLITPCDSTLRPARPPDPPDGPAVAVTFSGGGFRATFAAVGVVRYLADAGLLPNLRYASSVSGGSVANGMLAIGWPEVRSAGYTAAAVDEHVIEPLARKVTRSSLKTKLIRNVWRTTFSKTRTDVLAWAFDKWFYDGAELDELDPEVRWIFNAANLTTGVRFAFERDVVGDYVTGLAPTAGTGLRVSRAAAASASVPGAFAPTKLRGIEFPCATGASVRLLDGGAYDNTGLEAIDGTRYDEVFSISMNAGGVFVTGGYGKIPLVRELSRANSLLYRQSTGLRTRWMVQRFQARENTPPGQEPPPGSRRGVLFALASRRPDGESNPAYDHFVESYPEHRDHDGEDLAFVPTVFDRFSPELVRALVYRGWWLTGANLAYYHPDLTPLAPSVTAPPR